MAVRYWKKIEIKTCCLYAKSQYSIVCVICGILLLHSNSTNKHYHCASQIIRKLHVPNFWSEQLRVTFNISCPLHRTLPRDSSAPPLFCGFSASCHLSLLPPSVLNHHTSLFSSWDSWDSSPWICPSALARPMSGSTLKWHFLISDHVPLLSILQWLHTAIWNSPKSFTWFLSLKGMAWVYFHLFFLVPPPYGVKSIFISMYCYFVYLFF